jgi:hypothetical protein
MSERAPRNHEHHEEVILDPERELPTAEQAEPLRKGEQDPTKHLAEARAEIERSAESARENPVEQLKKAEKAEAQPEETHVNRELKGITLRRELQQIRRKESAPQRALSRVIHQPVIRVVSEAAGKTVSRPSGLLGGGLVALLGTSGYLFYAKHMGFEYNYFVFTALFIGGFAVGIGLELLAWLLTTPRRHHAK